MINGARQSGKTALLGVLQERIGGTYLSLDQASNLRLARTDPTGFVTGFDEPLLIDEVQRGGDPLVLAIKFALDQSRRRGRFVLAGSTRFLTEPRLTESLAGRVRINRPLPSGPAHGVGDGRRRLAAATARPCGPPPVRYMTVGTSPRATGPGWVRYNRTYACGESFRGRWDPA